MAQVYVFPSARRVVENAATERAWAGSLHVRFRGRPVERPLYLDAEEAQTFTGWLRIMNESGVPYAIGGAYAHYAVTGIWRDSKDLDAFLQPRHIKRALTAFRQAGYETELRDGYWLAKVHDPPHLFDFLFAVRHMTQVTVTAEWLRTSLPATFLDVPTRLLAPEEVIASKAYIGNRDRFDGADILHIIRSLQGDVDWSRLVELLRGDEEIVLWHLVLFAFVYPSQREWLPKALMERAFARVVSTPHLRPASAFRGLVIDPLSFEVDLDKWGYRDGRPPRPVLDDEGDPV
jgi:hypothetical protein